MYSINRDRALCVLDEGYSASTSSSSAGTMFPAVFFPSNGVHGGISKAFPNNASTGKYRSHLHFAFNGVVDSNLLDGAFNGSFSINLSSRDYIALDFVFGVDTDDKLKFVGIYQTGTENSAWLGEADATSKIVVFKAILNVKPSSSSSLVTSPTKIGHIWLRNEDSSTVFALQVTITSSGSSDVLNISIVNETTAGENVWDSPHEEANNTYWGTYQGYIGDLEDMFLGFVIQRNELTNYVGDNPGGEYVAC